MNPGNVESRSTPASLNATVIGLVEKGMEVGESARDLTEQLSPRLSTSLDEVDMRRSCTPSDCDEKEVEPAGERVQRKNSSKATSFAFNFGGSMSLEQLRKANLRAESNKGLSYLPMVRYSLYTLWYVVKTIFIENFCFVGP